MSPKHSSRSDQVESCLLFASDVLETPNGRPRDTSQDQEQGELAEFILAEGISDTQSGSDLLERMEQTENPLESMRSLRATSENWPRHWHARFRRALSVSLRFQSDVCYV
jgi:hypothetical protein